MLAEIESGITRWPAELEKEYLAAGYWENRSLGEQIFAVADKFPQRSALVDPDHGIDLTFAQLTQRADATAARLLQLGFQPGDRAIIALPNTASFIVLLLGMLRAGILPVLALPNHRHFELKTLALSSGARAYISADVVRGFDHRELGENLTQEVPNLEMVIIDGEPNPGQLNLTELLAAPHANEVEPLRQRFDALDPPADEPALFLLSGGTTGVPKLIVRTHNDYVYNAKASLKINQFTHHDVFLAVMPISHNFPLACPGVLGALLSGAKTVITASPNPKKVFPIIKKYGVTHTALVPAVAQSWIDYQQQEHTGDLTSLKTLQVGGSRMPDSLAIKVNSLLGAQLQQVFGMAEGLINMTRLDDSEVVINTTQGRPISPADEVRVVNEHFEDVAPGEEGEILTRGPYTPRGYFANQEANEKSFHDGWYASGDVIHRRPDGNIVVHGRNKDIINRGGEKISAEEIESFIYYIDGVSRAAVVAMSHPVLHEDVCLVVELSGRTTLTVTEATEHLDAFGVARYKHPAKIIVVDHIPMTKIDKIDKKALRDLVAEQVK